MSAAPLPRSTSSASTRDSRYYVAALALGAIAGWSQVALQDISLLLAAGFTLFLAVARPRQPWRWALIVGLCLPAAEGIAYLARWHPERGAVAESFLGIILAMMCAFGGAFLRRAVGILFPPGT